MKIKLNLVDELPRCYRDRPPGDHWWKYLIPFLGKEIRVESEPMNYMEEYATGYRLSLSYKWFKEDKAEILIKFDNARRGRN